MSWLDKIKKYLKDLWEKINPSSDTEEPVTPPVDPVVPPADPVDPTNPSNPPSWQPASTAITAIFMTPMFTMQNINQVKSQAKLLKTAGYTDIASLVDLQTGTGQRNYIFAGRTATSLASACLSNIQAVKDAGLTPIIMIRNDWAIMHKTGDVPSVGGQPANQVDFYSASRLESEKTFLLSLKPLYPYVHFQLSLEASLPQAAQFNLSLAQFLRAQGFQNRIIVNLIDQAFTAQQSLLGSYAGAKCEMARSWHAATPSPDKIWNTDGRPGVNSGNVKSVIATILASGKDMILWTSDTANSPNGLPAAYYDSIRPTTPVVPPAPDPVVVGDNSFLWKPVSESRQGRCCVITPANLNVKNITVNGANETAEYAGRANGNRQHYFLKKTGRDYGMNVKVIATLTDGTTRTWVIPDGSQRKAF